MIKNSFYRYILSYKIADFFLRDDETSHVITKFQISQAQL